MTKRRFRIDSGHYGGELVIGTVNPEFVEYYKDHDESDLIDAIMELDDGGPEEPEDALLDPNSPPAPTEEYYMWECDDIEHQTAAFSDSNFHVYEVPADGSEDMDWEKEIWEGAPQFVYSREGGYISDDTPTEEERDQWLPVLAFFSSEKGSFGAWFFETDGEDFDPYKLGFGSNETHMGEFVDRVYYNKEEIDCEYDYAEGTGKGYYAKVGYLNKKWHDAHDKYFELDKEIWEDFDESVKYDKEKAENN